MYAICITALITHSAPPTTTTHTRTHTDDDPHNPCLLPVWNQFDCTNSVGQGGGGGRQSCVVCTNEHPCLFDVLADEGETTNLAKRPEFASIVQTMQAKLATYATPYVPMALTPNNLACYNCSFDPDALWKNFTGPGCIAKAAATAALTLTDSLH